jgi:pimeloyl-ACP methyl ester carboxylesterase
MKTLRHFLTIQPDNHRLFCRKGIRSFSILLIILLILFTWSCGFFHIQQRDNAVTESPVREKGENEGVVYNSCILMGEVISKEKYDYPVSVIAYSLSFSNKKNLDYIILDHAGPFMMYVPEGRYLLYAISDFNNDTFFEDTEVSSIYKDGEEVSVRKGEIKKDILLVTDKHVAEQVTFPRKFTLQDDTRAITYMGKNGQIRKLYDEMFSLKNAKVGLWKPSSFMKAYGANIYCMEKYDPGKIPVLFVHGSKGSPQDWVYFLIRLDRTRYQSWFFYYPSGIRLSLTSRILYENLISLQEKYGFQKIVLTAHSMGGLVTRALLTNPEFKKNISFVKLYITLATPWTGFASADTAIRFSFKKLPNWFDMGTRSAFVKRIMRARLPESMNYYLFYGKQDKISKGKAVDDRAFIEAKDHIGFDCDHETILSDRKVFDKYDEILDQEL